MLFAGYCYLVIVVKCAVHVMKYKHKRTVLGSQASLFPVKEKCPSSDESGAVFNYSGGK